VEKENKKKHICIECGQEFNPDEALFECYPNMCSYCTQEKIKNRYGYDGDLI